MSDHQVKLAQWWQLPLKEAMSKTLFAILKLDARDKDYRFLERLPDALRGGSRYPVVFYFPCSCQRSVAALGGALFESILKDELISWGRAEGHFDDEFSGMHWVGEAIKLSGIGSTFDIMDSWHYPFSR